MAEAPGFNMVSIVNVHAKSYVRTFFHQFLKCLVSGFAINLRLMSRKSMYIVHVFTLYPLSIMFYVRNTIFIYPSTSNSKENFVVDPLTSDKTAHVSRLLFPP